MSREHEARARVDRQLDPHEVGRAPGKSTLAPMLQRKNNGDGVTRISRQSREGAAAQSAQSAQSAPGEQTAAPAAPRTAGQSGPAILDDAQFLAFFSHVEEPTDNAAHPIATVDLTQLRYVFSPPQEPRPVHELFTADEQRAINAFMASPRLPPVGTFRAFFDGTASDGQKFLFAAVLHVLDRSRTVANEPRAVRADDCGDWVSRVIAYRFNQAFHRRSERARMRRENHRHHLPGVPSPEGMYSFSDDQGNATRVDPQSPSGRSHTAISQERLAALQPGDWLMLHWHPHRSPGDDNHSVMFLGWDPPGPQPRWHDGYVGIRVANQINNDKGGGFINHLDLCADADRPRYVYHVSRVQGLSAAETAHGPEQQNRQADAAQHGDDQHADSEPAAQPSHEGGASQ